MQFMGLVLAAIVVEGIVSYIKLFFVEGKFQWQNIVAILLGILVTVSYRIDIFDLLKFTSVIPYVGMVLTGILVSRGSNYIYEFIKMITNITEKTKLSNESAKSAK